MIYKHKIVYPEKYKERFFSSRNIHFNDGSVVTPEEIWDYLVHIAPQKYPYAFESDMFYGSTASNDVLFATALKNTYLNLTISERLEKAKDNGVSVAFIQGGQSIDPYTAAGVIALRPALVNMWSRGRHNGVGVSDEELGRKTEKEKAYRGISFEACNTAGYEHIQEDDLRIDVVAPYSALRCSDISYGLEAHRHGKNRDKVKLFLADFPMSHQAEKEWAITYFAQNLKRLIRELDSITGRTTTEEDLKKAIALHNKGRRLAIEIADMWWAAKVPPTNGLDRSALFTMGLLEMHADTQASLDVLTEARDLVAERIRNGERGYGIVENPKRIFVCGSCVHLDEFRIESEGGIVVGTDNSWSHCSTLVEEAGDPYYSLAKATLAYPYEQSITKRAEWTIEQVRKSRADGLLFLYNWGCNTQSAIARAICDVVKKETGLPTLVSENELVGLEPEQQENRISAFVEMVG